MRAVTDTITASQEKRCLRMPSANSQALKRHSCSVIVLLQFQRDRVAVYQIEG
jgi:hypothetical protein